MSSITETAQKNFLKFFLIIGILCFLFLPIFLGLVGTPDEDAAILYSYSGNLATNGVISYYPGGERVEGATDFLWMILIAFGQRLGIDNHLFAGILNSVFLTLVPIRIYSFLKSIGSNSATYKVIVSFFIYGAIAFLSGAYLSGLGGFSTIATCSCAAVIFLSLVFNRLDTIFISSSIIFVLLRPDSIYIYISIIGALLFGKAINGQKIKLSLRKISIGIIPLIIFSSYWFWRYQYFGDFFPLPFYVKEAASIPDIKRTIEGLILHNYSIWCYVLLSLSWMILNIEKESLRVEQSNIVPDITIKSKAKSKNIDNIPSEEFIDRINVAIVSIIFFNILLNIYLSSFTHQQNIYYRFQSYSIAIPLALFSFVTIYYYESSLKLNKYDVIIPKLVNSNYLPTNLIVKRKYILFFSSFLIISSFLSSVKSIYKYSVNKYRDNIIALAIELKKINEKKPIRSLLVTEAGVLAYYSGIKTIDAWGLNTYRYAKRPLMDVESVIKENPCIINSHMNISSIFKQKKDIDFEKRNWEAMTIALYRGAKLLNHKIFLVPHWVGYRVDWAEARRLDFFSVSPNCLAKEEIIKSLTSFGAKEISSQDELKEFTSSQYF